MINTDSSGLPAVDEVDGENKMPAAVGGDQKSSRRIPTNENADPRGTSKITSQIKIVPWEEEHSAVGHSNHIKTNGMD